MILLYRIFSEFKACLDPIFAQCPQNDFEGHWIKVYHVMKCSCNGTTGEYKFKLILPCGPVPEERVIMTSWHRNASCITDPVQENPRAVNSIKGQVNGDWGVFCCSWWWVFYVSLGKLLNKESSFDYILIFVPQSAMNFFIFDNKFFNTIPTSYTSFMDNFVNAASQWETTLHCNVVSHWLGACTKWSLHL